MTATAPVPRKTLCASALMEGTGSERSDPSDCDIEVYCGSTGNVNSSFQLHCPCYLSADTQSDKPNLFKSTAFSALASLTKTPLSLFAW